MNSFHGVNWRRICHGTSQCIRPGCSRPVEFEEQIVENHHSSRQSAADFREEGQERVGLYLLFWEKHMFHKDKAVSGATPEVK